MAVEMNYAATASITCTMNNITNGSYRQSTVIDNIAVILGLR